MGSQSRFLEQTYDLVITDWKLPDGDGRLIANWAAELGAKTLAATSRAHRPVVAFGRAATASQTRPLPVPSLLLLVPSDQPDA